MGLVFLTLHSITVFWLTTEFTNISADDLSYCYSTDNNPYVKFGTCSLYRLNFPQADWKIIGNKECKTAYIYSLIRVGPRYFTKYNTEHLTKLRGDILKNHTDKRGFLSQHDVDLFRKWSSKGNKKTSDEPVIEANIETETLGRRLAQAFKSVEADPGTFNFWVTKNPTSQLSALALLQGVLNEQDASRLLLNEEKLRFIESTPGLEEKLFENGREKMLKCLESEPINALTERVSRRLGFTANLFTSSIENMYYACAFETAWVPNEKSAFCAAFTKTDLNLLEYCMMDVFGYYEWGHGAPSVHNLILDELSEKLTAAIQSQSSSPEGDFNVISGVDFTHTIAKLGLYRDEEDLPVNSALKKSNYQWSMSDICPFNANLVVVLHRCGANNEPKISLYHNERLIKVPGCHDDLCSWSHFQNTIQENNP